MLIKKLVLGAMALAVGGVLWAAETPKREALFFIGAHPDDSEGFAATAFLLRDKYDIHVIDLTRGELGLGMKGYEDGTTAKRRVEEEKKACAYLGATPHFLAEIDGFACAGKPSVDMLTKLIDELKPRAVFTHWPVDNHADHTQTAAVTLNALRFAKHKPERYFFEVMLGQTMNFRPTYYVDVTSTISNKVKMLNHYICQGGETYLWQHNVARAKLHGKECGFAFTEMFATFDGKPLKGGVIDSLRESLCVAPPADDTFTFASWNIGHFSLGNSCGTAIPAAEGAARAKVYAAFVDEVGADVFGVAEYSDAFCKGAALRSPKVVFGRYPKSAIGPSHNYQWNGHFWKNAQYVSSRTVEYPHHDQLCYYIATRLEIAGREVVFVETHLDWRTFLKGHENDRKLQMEQLVRDFRNEPYVVIAGDFNVGIRFADPSKKSLDNPAEYRVFADAGFTLGNDGRYKTCPAGRTNDPENCYALDNIIVKGLEIEEFKVFDRPDLSDHALVRARLKFIR